MAYAALVYVDQQLENLLPKHDEYIHLYEKKQMESLHSNVISLQKFLEDFPRNFSLIKQLESQITEIAYGVSDMIESGISGERNQFMFKSCFTRVGSIVEDATEIRKVLEMKANIAGYDDDSWITSSSSTVAEPSGKDTTVGLDEDLSKTKERIVGRNPALQIIPITGMGGIGKTTLAKNVYEDPLIVAHFDVRVWVTVSQEYNAQKILKEILGDTERKTNEPLIIAVHKRLSGRRFLIVMDDIWSVEAWDSVRNAFPDGRKGSRLVITTRLTEVATKVGSSSPLHEMQLMNEIQSWDLFQKEAFIEKECCPPPMEKVGKIISGNCKGLPLAIVVIGRLLKLNYKQNYWENFARNMNEAMDGSTQDNQVMEILALSYNNLPPHLKACFLYTSMFPEDADIPTKKLKRLWAAEGFLKPARDRSIEEWAEECLVDLVERNLLSVSTRRSSGGIKSCIIHDLLRDLSLRKAKEDKFSQQIINCNTDKTTNVTWKFFQKQMPWFKEQTNSQVIFIRRCMGINNPAILRLYGVNKTTYVHVFSLICHDRINDKDMLPLMRSKLVRVVDVLQTPIQCPISFGVNLRYLAFSCSGDYDKIKYTLANICKLKNLETLITEHDYFTETVFFPILEMPKLKHFVVHSGLCLTDNHNNSVSNKSQLKTLSEVRDFELTTDATEVLANLVNLKIRYLVYMTNHGFLSLNNLVCLHQLEKLNLQYMKRQDSRNYMSLPNNIAFPDKLKKITLCGFLISWETMSVMGSLPDLQVLKLVDCKFESDEWEPVEGEFQQLKYLKLGVQDLWEWKVESNHFPCLEQLNLEGCCYYLKLPAEVGEIESLHTLVIGYCNRRLGDSARKIQEVQQSYGNYQLKLVEND